MNKDMDKTVFDNIDLELDKTLDATVAEGLEIGATIKSATIAQGFVHPAVSLVANPDNSQTLTLQREGFSYEQQTVFAGSTDDIFVAEDIEKTIIDSPADSAQTLLQNETDKTLIQPEQNGTGGKTAAGGVDSAAATIIQQPQADDAGSTATETVASGEKSSVIAAATVAAGSVPPEADSSALTLKDDHAGKTASSAMAGSGTDTRSGGTVRFNGGSISVNVRPRNISSIVSGIGDKTGAVSGAGGTAFSDFELIAKLGEGGMGVVYSARQSSIDRAIALKMIKSSVVSEDAKSKFLIEAVVTGDLDHPNIVPVHDLGVDSAGNMFYAMKQVSGVAWSKAIRQNTRSENIEILLRVCDALAFAHDRGVIHRDLKPENVMLGTYGEVLVMDWGLALAVNDKAKAEAIGPNTGIAGTPAYLAPEMARAGSWELLGFCSDIYLLGAILFEIITGKRPHTGKNVRECLKNAAKNIIIDVEQKGELISIAYKAMSTNPRDRYASVKAFQRAIRDYLSHSESITLADKAATDLALAEKSGEYDDYAKALFGFRQAVELWRENSEAVAGELRVGIAYARAALKKGDLDLGLSLVTEAEEFAPIRQELLSAREIRQKHQRRLKLLTRGIAVLGIVIVVISVVAAIWIQRERTEAIAQREEAKRQEQIAVTQREEAKRQGKIAVIQREEAKRQARIAEEQREEAKRQEAIANEKKLLAQAESRRANEQTRIAQEQRGIALKEKSIAEAETKRANEQTLIAQKARSVAERERTKAQKSEEKALAAIDKMVRAQTQQQLEKARREAAELTAKETQEELSSRDELKENKWWLFKAEKARQMQQEAAEKSGLPVAKTVNLGGTDLAFRLIPAGRFGMGSRLDEPGRSSEEYLHRVEISKPYYMAVMELTLKDWNALTGEKGSAEGNYPVWNVSYADIKNILLPALNSRMPAGWEVRLPTEAEWEWAARAGTGTPYYSGSSREDLLKVGYTGAELLTSAKEVGQLDPNAWGLYDMLGNLAEWCEDMYVRDAYISEDEVQVDPVVTTGGKHYVVRGGAWSNLPEHCRAAYRSYANKNSQYNFLGVRLVLVPKE